MASVSKQLLWQQGGYNIGQGAKAISNGEYLHGTVQVVNGTLMVAGSVSAQAAISAKPAPVTRYLSNDSAPALRQALTAESQRVRMKLPEEYRQIGNLAIAKIDVKGLPQRMEAFILSKKGNMDLFRYLKQKFLNLYLLINIKNIDLSS